MRHALPWLATWFALFWLWMLLVGEWNRQEWIAAASAATVAASVGEIARARAKVHGPLPVGWIVKAASVPHMVVADFGVLMWALARPRVVRGEFHTRPFAQRVPVRAWAGWLATFSPNAYVVDIDDERALVHDLVEWRRSESPLA